MTITRSNISKQVSIGGRVKKKTRPSYLLGKRRIQKFDDDMIKAAHKGYKGTPNFNKAKNNEHDV